MAHSDFFCTFSLPDDGRARSAQALHPSAPLGPVIVRRPRSPFPVVCTLKTETTHVFADSPRSSESSTIDTVDTQCEDLPSLHSWGRVSECSDLGSLPTALDDTSPAASLPSTPYFGADFGSVLTALDDPSPATSLPGTPCGGASSLPRNLTFPDDEAVSSSCNVQTSCKGTRSPRLDPRCAAFETAEEGGRRVVQSAEAALRAALHEWGLELRGTHTQLQTLASQCGLARPRSPAYVTPYQLERLDMTTREELHQEQARRWRGITTMFYDGVEAIGALAQRRERERLARRALLESSEQAVRRVLSEAEATIATSLFEHHQAMLLLLFELKRLHHAHHVALYYSN